jgi:hypothetical protein
LIPPQKVGIAGKQNGIWLNDLMPGFIKEKEYEK